MFESVLDLPSFSLRVAQKDIPRLLDILLAVTPQQVAAMQASLAKVWHRCDRGSAATAPKPV